VPHQFAFHAKMKLTAVSILKWNGEQEANLLGLSADLSSFGYFQRGSVKEMLIFVSRTVAKRTQPGQRQTVQNEEYFCHVHNRDGLVGIAFVDKDYPSRAAFSIVNKVLDDFVEASGNKWRTVREDTQDAIPILDSAITKYQVRHHKRVRWPSCICIFNSFISSPCLCTLVHSVTFVGAIVSFRQLCYTQIVV
jgi:hypothetical protein